MLILVALILSRFDELSVYAAQKTGNLQMDTDFHVHVGSKKIIHFAQLLRPTLQAYPAPLKNFFQQYQYFQRNVENFFFAPPSVCRAISGFHF